MAELGLAVVATVDLCYKYGKSLYKSCQAFRHADERLREHAIRFESCWVQVESQLEFVGDLANSGLMKEQYCRSQERVIQVLATKLQIADKKLDGMLEPASGSAASDDDKYAGPVKTKRWKYALLRDGLIEAVTDLESWQARFDPSWFLLMTIASPLIDDQLATTIRRKPEAARTKTSHISAARKLRSALSAETRDSGSTTILRPGGLDPASLEAVPYCTVKAAKRAKNGQVVLINPITGVPKSLLNNVIRDIRNFSSKLQYANPVNFGLLECKGILKNEVKNASEPGAAQPLPGVSDLSLIFRLPSTRPNMQSLRHRLLEWDETHYDSLSQRFSLAQQLVRAVSYVHTFGFVHKNIRPETVLHIYSAEDVNNDIKLNNGTVGSDTSDIAVLVGFDVLRHVGGSTRRAGDDDWQKNIYRHPLRQSSSPQVNYEMRHDIYSVGVCLLEIGLWESFVVYGDWDQEKDPLAEDALVDADGRVVGCPELGRGLCSNEEEKGSIRKLLEDPKAVKDHLVQLARGKLRRKMGTRYSQVVENCLTCLDEGNEDFGDESEFQDELGGSVSAMYIEKVVGKLEDIRV